MGYILDHEGKMYRKFFEDICSIPHVSFKEKGLSDYIVKFAQERDLWYSQDDYWNVIVKKPASPGYEDHAPVIIQGHTDMVGVKSPDSDHDFDKDPIPLYVEDGFIRSHGTTLGADCGHGISFMLSVLDDNTLKHPPIEAVFSVQEEVGMGGAINLDYSLLSAKRVIFTDSMEEGRPEMSTTAVVGGDLIKKCTFSEDGGAAYKVTIDGLLGGHGAVNINDGRGNAINLMSRLLVSLRKKDAIRIADITGGDLRNNIPKYAEVTFTSSLPADEIEAFAAEMDKTFKFEFREHDPAVAVSFEKCDAAATALSEAETNSLVDWIRLLPTGTFATSKADPSFPWTSRNLGTLRIEDSEIIVGYQYRSNMQSHIDSHMDEMEIVNSIFDITWRKEFGYAGYVVEPGTPMYNAYDKAYRELTGKGLTDKHIHAGTEVGTLINGLGGDVDVVGIGPNTYKFHTPFEEMELESFDRAYQCIVKVLEML